jgi:hypothetical protein
LTLPLLLPALVILEITTIQKNRGRILVSWGRVLLTFLPLVILYLCYNKSVTGNPFVTGRQFFYPEALFGFGTQAAHRPTYGSLGHTPVKGVLNIVMQFGTLSTGLLGWPLISLVPALVGILLRDRDRWSWAFVLIPCTTACVLFFSWYSAIEHGPRHYLDSWPGIMILTAMGIAYLWNQLKNRAGTVGTNAMTLAIAGLFIVSFALYVPVRVKDILGPWLGVDPVVRKAVAEKIEPNAIVFMEFPEAPADYYCSGFVHNDPFLKAPIIFARHMSATEDSICRQHFSDRTAYYLRYDPAARAVSITPFDEIMESGASEVRSRVRVDQ